MSHPTLYSVLDAEKKQTQLHQAALLAQQSGAFDPTRMALSGFGANLRLQQPPAFIDHTSALMARAVPLGQSVHRHPLQQMTVMNPLPLDPQAAMSIAQYGYAQLLHGPGTRKNATRESTTSLKNWLKEHQKNPYPTKAEKVYLALVSGMTLTQVSTWFANARRRLKKENKWSPDAGFEDDEEKATSLAEMNSLKAEESGYSSHNDGSGSGSGSGEPSSPLASPTRSPSDSPSPSDDQPTHGFVGAFAPSRVLHQPIQVLSHQPMVISAPSSISNQNQNQPSKKIWSLAEMSASSSNMSEDDHESDQEVQVN